MVLLISCQDGSGDYPLAISFVSNGKIDLKPLVTHRSVAISLHSDASGAHACSRFAFDDAVKAFEVTQKGHSENGKGVIKTTIDGPP